MEALLSVDGDKESRDEAALIQVAVSASCLWPVVLRLSGVRQASQDGSRRFDLISLDATCSWIWNASPPTLGLLRRRVGCSVEFKGALKLIGCRRRSREGRGFRGPLAVGRWLLQMEIRSNKTCVFGIASGSEVGGMEG
ncbi:unnamed protein product [Arctogadus glacialis]